MVYTFVDSRHIKYSIINLSLRNTIVDDIAYGVSGRQTLRDFLITLLSNENAKYFFLIIKKSDKDPIRIADINNPNNKPSHLNEKYIIKVIDIR